MMDSSSAVLADVELVPELDQLTQHTSTAGSCGAGRPVVHAVCTGVWAHCKLSRDLMVWPLIRWCGL